MTKSNENRKPILPHQHPIPAYWFVTSMLTCNHSIYPLCQHKIHFPLIGAAPEKIVTIAEQSYFVQTKFFTFNTDNGYQHFLLFLLFSTSTKLKSIQYD